MQFLGWCQEFWANLAVVRRTKVLGKVIREDCLARSPVIPELLLVRPIPHPPIAHVRRLGLLGLQILGDEV